MRFAMAQVFQSDDVPNQVVEVDFTDATARQKVPESFEDEKPIVLKGLRFDWNAELVRHIEVPTSGTR